MKCKNCQNIFEGNYCNTCGQNSNVNRINISSIINELSESVFQINKGLFYTLKELSIRPAKTLNDYLGGKRIKHFKPLAYLLLTSTVYFLITQMTHSNTWIDDIISGWMQGSSHQNTQGDIPSLAKWFARNYAYTNLLFLPVFSLASYLSFYNSDKNYLEHIVVNSYITGHQAIIYSFFAIVGIVIKSPFLDFIPLLTAISYTFVVFAQLFVTKSRIGSILRTMTTYALYILMTIVIVVILSAIYNL